MKKLMLIIMLFTGIVNAQIVNIPDPGFMANLIHYGVDTNSDGQIQVTEALAVTTLTIDYLETDYVNSLTGIESFTNLTYLDCKGWNIGTLDLTTITNLETLKCTNNYLTNLNISGLTNLVHLECDNNSLTTINLSGMSNLAHLDCSESGLTSLDLFGLTSLDYLDCKSNNFTSLNLNVCPSLTYVECNLNNLGALDVSGMNNLMYLDCGENNISSLNLGTINSLEWLNCSNNLLTSLNVSNQTNLKSLFCGGNQLTTLDVLTLSNLIDFEISANQISTINVSGLTSLKYMYCSSMGLTALDVSALTQLETLIADTNQLTSLNLTPLVNLMNLYVYDNQLTSLNLTNLVSLDQLLCYNNLLTSIDISVVPNLDRLEINGGTSLIVNNPVNLTRLWMDTTVPNNDFSNLSQLTDLEFTSPATSLDISNCGFLLNVSIGSSPNLTYLNTKNGTLVFNGNYYISVCPNLQYICADEENILPLQDIITNGGGNNANVNINTYCSFNPGGDYNTISGIVRFDENGNGCDAADATNTFIKVKIDDETTQGASFTDANGNYSFFTQTGDFTLTPDIENPAYFLATPASQVVNFPVLDNSTQTVNFCLSPNGIHYDAEIIMMQNRNARPGFDADYILVYRNTGNQTISGTINVEFDDSLTDFVSANPDVSTQTPGLLTWTYSNLKPFENAQIEFTLNINSPTEIPAVNDGDQLNFDGTIFYNAGTQSDGVRWNQTVMNSLDPNNKICLEGDSISPENLGEYLHYNISFENIGTADAINIVIKDVINPSQFDVSSLRVMSSSHPVEVKILGNNVEFIFQNINLPSAIADPIGGHGNVLFKIKTLPTLPIGTMVSNSANIYFDYNFPIETNEARTTFETLSNTDFIKDSSISIYPNPAKDLINIKSESSIKSIQLFDIQGRILQTSIENKNTAIIDVSDKSDAVFFLKITTEKGIKIEKIIKE